MEGLEIIEVSIKTLFSDFRIDAETYRPFYQKIENQVKNHEYVTLGGISSKLKKGIFDIKSETYTAQGIPFVRISNLKNMGISMDDIIYIPDSENNKNLDTFLQKGDIILSKTATPAASIVQIKHCNCSQDTVAIKLADKNFKGSFIVTFLNSRYGYYQMQRWFTGNIQMHLNLADCKNIFIPKLPLAFQEELNKLFWSAFNCTKQSQSLYHQAEELLLEAIGLKDFQPSRENINIKTFKESFLATGRLDAEYYQPKYDEIVSKVKRREYNLLGNLVSIRKSIEPGSEAYSDEGLPFLRVADYNKFGISTPEKKLSAKFCNENRLLLNGLKPQKETILFSKDGSVGVAYMLRENADFITSGAILHLTVKNSEVLPAYLTLALNSEIVRQQSERDVGGSIILHWRIDEIKNVLVPIANIAIQREIAALIEQSFSLRKESERLLNEAKEMVEKEIEQTANATQKQI